MRTLILAALLSLVGSSVGANEPSTHFEILVRFQGRQDFKYNTTFNTTNTEIPLSDGLKGAKWRCVVMASSSSPEFGHIGQILMCSDGKVTVSSLVACHITQEDTDSNEIGLHLYTHPTSNDSVYLTQQCHTSVAGKIKGLPTQRL